MFRRRDGTAPPGGPSPAASAFATSANARSFIERSASGETQVLQQHLAKMFAEAGEALAGALPGLAVRLQLLDHGVDPRALLVELVERGLAAGGLSGLHVVADCANGAASQKSPSSWYAFDAGTARFYVLDADWTDSNVGTSNLYGQDYLNHWSPGDAEYEWLRADLAAHPGGLKFATFHFPLHSDNATEASDTYLQGTSSLEGLLASNGVDMVFNGHAHIYERNVAVPGGLTRSSFGTNSSTATRPPGARQSGSARRNPSRAENSSFTAIRSA